jgi:rod shape-determining protein MreB
MLGERTAEELKIVLGSAVELKEKLTAPMRGRDLVSGLPKEIVIDDEQIRLAIQKSVKQIVEAIRVTMEETPPELIADIMAKGIVLCGGGALLRGLDRLVKEVTHTAVHIADDPLTSVVRGTGLVLEDLETLKTVLVPIQFNP